NADLGQRAARAARDSSVLNDPRKGCAQIVGADGQVVAAEKNIPVSLDRTNRHAGRIVRTDVELAVAKNLVPGRTAGRIIKKENGTTRARPTVSDECGIGSGRGAKELRK